jgi:hypothetical protein
MAKDWRSSGDTNGPNARHLPAGVQVALLAWPHEQRAEVGCVVYRTRVRASRCRSRSTSAADLLCAIARSRYPACSSGRSDAASARSSHKLGSCRLGRHPRSYASSAIRAAVWVSGPGSRWPDASSADSALAAASRCCLSVHSGQMLSDNYISPSTTTRSRQI